MCGVRLIMGDAKMECADFVGSSGFCYWNNREIDYLFSVNSEEAEI